MAWRRTALLAAFICAAFTPYGHVMAAGAVAIALPEDVARDGFASGSSINASTEEAARQGALDGCRRSAGQGQLRSLCKVVATFTNKCFAIAIDPKDGTPGAGWGVGDDQQSADSKALAECQRTAGADRREFCIVPDNTAAVRSRGCDGDAR